MATAITTLKSYFENGKKPTEQEFAELIDAFVHRDDNLQSILGQIAQISEAQQGVVNDKYMTPFLTKIAIDALTRLANNPGLEAEVDAKDNQVKADIRGGIGAPYDTLMGIMNYLAPQIGNHIIDLGNPHAVTKWQVGLGNIPNAVSDSISLNDSLVLASSKAVKLLNDAKEDAFNKNTAFNKNFGFGSNDVARGNHTHDRLHYSGISKAQVGPSGLDIHGLWNMTVNNHGVHNTAMWNESAHTTMALQNIPGTTYFTFHTNGEIKAGGKHVVRDDGQRTINLAQFTNEVNFIGSGIGGSNLFMNFRKGGTGSFFSDVNQYTFCTGGGTSSSLADIKARSFLFTGTVTNVSDERLKRNVQAFPNNTTDKLKLLAPVLYLLHSEEDKGKTMPDRFGLIAQQVEAIYPEIVVTHEDGYKSIDYTKLTVPLIKGFQEQQSEIDALKLEIEAIKNQINNP